MSEPITVNKTLIVPNTGDLPGSWGTAALNPNFQLIDAMFGGVTSISLSGATTILLTVPATTGIWGGFVPQSSNSMITLMGTQTGSAVLQFSLPGFYIINNKCTGTTFVQLAPATGGGNKIGVPQGKKSKVFYDGTDLDFVDPLDPGAALDLHGWTALPPWMGACTVAPYLVKDGSVYTASLYPALAAVLGSTFGGDGFTTFGVPDERARARIALDTVQVLSGATSARITFAQAGFTASVMGAAGGTSAVTLATGNLPPYTPSGTIGQTGAVYGSDQASIEAAGGGQPVTGAPTGISQSFFGNAQGGISAPLTNVQPAIVSFLPLLKT
jgi:microcystin-dependent protein